MKRAMTKSFRDAFIAAVQRSGWSISKVAERAGVSVEQLKKLNQGRSLSTNVDDAIKVAHAFGLTLDEFLEDETVSDRAHVVDLYNQLSESERKFLRAAARGLSSDPQEGSE